MPCRAEVERTQVRARGEDWISSLQLEFAVLKTKRPLAETPYPCMILLESSPIGGCARVSCQIGIEYHKMCRP